MAEVACGDATSAECEVASMAALDEHFDGPAASASPDFCQSFVERSRSCEHHSRRPGTSWVSVLDCAAKHFARQRL